MNELKVIVDAIEKVKGHDILVYDMKGYSPLFDYMVIATVDSNRQSDACAEYVIDELSKLGMKANHIEGKSTAWVLVDCRDIIVHIFTQEERERYGLEKIYLDVPKINF